MLAVIVCVMNTVTARWTILLPSPPHRSSQCMGLVVLASLKLAKTRVGAIRANSSRVLSKRVPFRKFLYSLWSNKDQNGFIPRGAQVFPDCIRYCMTLSYGFSNRKRKPAPANEAYSKHQRPFDAFQIRNGKGKRVNRSAGYSQANAESKKLFVVC